MIRMITKILHALSALIVCALLCPPDAIAGQTVKLVCRSPSDPPGMISGRYDFDPAALTLDGKENGSSWVESEHWKDTLHISDVFIKIDKLDMSANGRRFNMYIVISRTDGEMTVSTDSIDPTDGTRHNESTGHCDILHQAF
jgi:hypothetical protein